MKYMFGYKKQEEHDLSFDLSKFEEKEEFDEMKSALEC